MSPYAVLLLLCEEDAFLSVHVEVRGQLHRVHSLLSHLHGFWELNWGHQACVTPLPTQLSRWPSNNSFLSSLQFGDWAIGSGLTQRSHCYVIWGSSGVCGQLADE